VVEFWHDRKIEAGNEWAKEIDANLESADVILLLVSADFLASDYCYCKEMDRALERHKNGLAKVIPVILRPCEWQEAPFSHIQALPQDTRPVTLWSNRDEAYTNIARGIRLACQNLQTILKEEPRTDLPQIEIVCQNVVNIECDVLVLKYAQAHYGVDAAISDRLTDARISPKSMQPLPGKYCWVESNEVLLSHAVLFIGVLPLPRFGYSQIREFGHYALKALTQENKTIKHICLTMHGAGYGLDEREAFLALLGGLYDAFREGAFPHSLEQISIVEGNNGRADRLKKLLDESDAENGQLVESLNATINTFEDVFNAGLTSGSKPHVFVAMPFAPEMEDVYIFGIQGPVQAAGFLCERGDFSSFTGDVVSRVKSRIDTASLVIADLSGANPNVYLEVGYAWGKNRPTLFLSNDVASLTFDAQTYRCIVYKTINELAKSLQKDLGDLR